MDWRTVALLLVLLIVLAGGVYLEWRDGERCREAGFTRAEFGQCVTITYAPMP